MSKIKKVFYTAEQVIETLLIIFLALYLIIVLCQRTINKNSPIFIGNYSLFEVASSSMESNLHIRDIILIERNASYEVGDIITYKENNYYVTHRVVEINDDYIITKGDANNVNDAPIMKKQIVGKLIHKMYILSILNNYFIFILMIILIYIGIKTFLKKEKNKD